MAKIIVALGLLLSATTAGLAQSQTGANFGTPYSGTAGARTPMFSDKGNAKYIVENIYETFVHRNENSNTYHIPVRKKKVYVISKN